MSLETTTEINEVPQLDAVEKSPRNFRSVPDVENFYRFIYENDLRRETKLILETLWSRFVKKGKRKKSSSSLH